jgi:tetratricopeptide (TPR) repeat protein
MQSNKGIRLKDLTRRSKPEEAIKAYQNAIKLNALNISALTSLGMLAHEAEDIKTAVERYHQVRWDCGMHDWIGSS